MDHLNSVVVASPRRKIRWLRVVYLLAVFLVPIVAALSASSTTRALGTLNFKAATPFAWIDENNATNLPRAMYVQVQITNSTGAALSNLQVTFHNFTDTTLFTLDPSESPIRYVPSLANGASARLFWFINFADGKGNTLDPRFSVYSVTVSDGTSPDRSSGPLRLDVIPVQDAAVGSAPAVAIFGPGTYLGQLLAVTLTYQFGNLAANAFMGWQPAGNKDFDVSCYYLESTKVVGTDPQLSEILGIEDLHFDSANVGGGAFPFTVTYNFRVRCASGALTQIWPNGYMESGTQFKYVKPSTFLLFPQNPPTNPFTLVKFPEPAQVAPGGQVKYTIVITNRAHVPVFLDRVLDTQPPGTAFFTTTTVSQISHTNSLTSPASNSPGTIDWFGFPLATYNLPASLGAVSGTVTLQYTSTATAVAGLYTNTVCISSFGTAAGCALTRISVGSPTAVTLEKFEARALFESDQLMLVLAGVGVLVLGALAAVFFRRR